MIEYYRPFLKDKYSIATFQLQGFEQTPGSTLAPGTCHYTREVPAWVDLLSCSTGTFGVGLVVLEEDIQRELDFCISAPAGAEWNSLVFHMFHLLTTVCKLSGSFSCFKLGPEI